MELDRLFGVLFEEIPVENDTVVTVETVFV